MNKGQQERRWPAPANGGGATAVSGPAAVAAAAARARPARIMPHWVTAGGRSSVAPPPPPQQKPEPDYEVIEFPSDQYVNAKLQPAPKNSVNPHCGLCGAPNARMRCTECEGRALCVSCDEMYHRHPKRRAHRRHVIGGGDEERPPLPPKGAAATPVPPVPPPRRHKGRSDSFSSRGSRTPGPGSPGPAPQTPLHLRRPLPAAPPHLSPANCTDNSVWKRPSTAASFASPPSSPRPLQDMPEVWPGHNGTGWNTMDRRRSAGAPPTDGALRRAPHAASVFELHRPEFPQPLPVMPQQRFVPAQSMATLSCANCAGCQQQWRYGSNMSLDARGQEFHPAAGMWVNPWLPPMPQTYPHPHHSMVRPSSRAHSRMASRAASPAASVRSRRSRHGRRYREPEDYSDDEDSSDDRRSRRRDSLRRTTPSPLLVENERRNSRRDSSGTHRRDSPVRILSRESPARTVRETPRDARRDSVNSNVRRESPTRDVHGRRDSVSSHARRDSPMRILSRESPARSVREAPKDTRNGRRESFSSHERKEPPPRDMHGRRDSDNSHGPRESPVKMVARNSPARRERTDPGLDIASPVRRVRESPLCHTISSSDDNSHPAEPVAETQADELDAPPPPVPTSRWQCEFCTFVNEAGTRVCDICCRTPIALPRLASVDRNTTAPPTERLENLTIAERSRNTPEKAKPDEKARIVETATGPPKKGGDIAPSTPERSDARTEVASTERLQSRPDSTEETAVLMASPVQTSNVGTPPLGVKRVKKSTAEKVSTACGPSPPRDSPQRSDPASLTPGTASTGTSPLPQSISTQTYQSVEEARQAAQAGRPTSSTPDESSRSTRRRSSRSLRKDRRRRSPEPEHTSRSERSHSRHSFSSDRSIGTPARDWSPAPEEEWWREAGQTRSRSNSMLHHQQRRGPPRRLPPRRASHLDLYRESELRWHRPDLGDPYYPDVRDLYASQPDVTRAISLETLAARRQDTVRNQGMELVKLLREAEALGFTAEELHAATQQCGNDDPVQWLKSNWTGLVTSVQTVASKMGREAGGGDTVGTVSEREAREALRKHKGSVWQAVTECVQQRQRKYGELMSRGKFNREEVLTCLTAHHGDLEAAYLELTKTQLKPFLMKIWGPPEGVENESANLTPQPGTSGVAPVVIPSPSSSDTASDQVKISYLDKLKKFETILNKDATVQSAESVSQRTNLQNDPQVASRSNIENNSYVLEKMGTQNSATDILGGLNDLLSRAGMSISEQSLLSGLKNIMKLSEGEPKTSTVVQNEVEKLLSVSIENEFRKAYNDLTSSSPLPPIETTDTIYKEKDKERIYDMSYVIATLQPNLIQRVINQPGISNIHNKDGDQNVNISSTTNSNQFNLTESVTSSYVSVRPETNSVEKNQDLSDIVNDTHRLVQQMKEEMTSDITSYYEGQHNSESENGSSITPDSSEPESFYDEDQDSSYSESEEEISEKSQEKSEDEQEEVKSANKTSPRSTTSDENEQFEEAIDHTVSLNVEQSNIAALDAIVNSLHEIDSNLTIRSNTQEIPIVSTVTTIEGNIKNESISEAVTEFENSNTSSDIISLNKQIDNHAPLILTEKFISVVTETENRNNENVAQPISSVKTAHPNRSNESEEIPPEDYNNNVTSIKTFEELYESLSQNNQTYGQENINTRNERSETPEVIITETTVQTKNAVVLESTLAPKDSFETDPKTTDGVVTHRETSSSPDSVQELDKNNIEKSPLKINSEMRHTSPNNIRRQSIEKVGTSPNSDKSQNKSSIPKPKPNAYHGTSKSEFKPPTKVIVSKVPIRRNSLKQPNSPQSSAKPHFGSFQSGHVKKLQTSLFGKETKTAKIPIPVTKKEAPKSGLALVQPMPSKIITIQSESSAKKIKPFFQETCLSDDYMTETDDEAGRRHSPSAQLEPSQSLSEPEPLPITSRTVNGKVVDLTQVPLKDGSPERQIRMLVAEGVVENWQQAELAVTLAARGEPPAAALMAAYDCADLPSAIAYLKQECELCAGHAPAYEMVSMLCCTHRCCHECARTYFTVQITERSIFDCVCPFCKLPELQVTAAPPGDQEHEDEALEYFPRLEQLLRSVVERGVHELFQRKLRDRALMQDPNFKWCIECSSGFFVHPRQKRVKCPECRTVTCARCRKPWEKQHEGVSCEQFAEWKQNNDPETSLQAVQLHLQDNGIDCPKCKFRYSLTRGGCMHFTCTQCKYEFCCGCGKPFTMGAQCGLSDYCAKLGLHAHHPRNCLFYLRDKEPHQLQTLLQMNNIEYKTEPAEGEEASEETGPERRPRRCPVALQRETPGGLVDTTCNNDVPPQHAGLCKVHYLEYLAGLVMARKVDSLPIMDVSDVIAELRRRAIELPERGPWDSDPIYAGMCAEIVKEKIPLE